MCQQLPSPQLHRTTENHSTMDPPDCYNEAAQSASYQPSPGPPNKRARETATCESDFLTIGREIQNRSKHRVGSDLTEDNRFRSFFGCGAETALILWNMMHAYSCEPNNSQIEHFLWCLFFMKVYPAENVAVSVAGASRAMDPKTFWLYIWPMIRAVATLEIHVVSLMIKYFLMLLSF